MSLDLTSVEAKFNWGAEHLKAVKDEVLPWMQANPYSIVKKRNSDFTRYRIYLKIEKEPPLQRWTLIVSDAINNLRAALDHLIYAIATHESGQEPPPKEKKLAFVICDTPTDFMAMGNKIATLSQPVRTAIESVQPYNRPHPIIPPLLSILRDLSNADKHRLVRLAFAAMHEARIGAKWPENPLIKTIEIAANAGELRDGTEIARITFDAPCPNLEYDRIDCEIILALWHGKLDPTAKDWTGRSEFSALMSLVMAEVRHVIDTVVASAG